jgi:hypothetical protein
LAAQVVGLPLGQPLDEYLQQVASALVAGLTQTSQTGRTSGDGGAAKTPGVAGASVMVMQLGQVRATASTDPVAATLHECGQAANFGPSLDAARSGSLVCVDTTDPHTATPYPYLAEGPLASVRGIAAIPSPVPSYVITNPAPTAPATATGPPPRRLAVNGATPPAPSASTSADRTTLPSRAGSRARRRRGSDTTRAVVTVHSLTGPITPEALAMTQALVTAVAGPAIANAVTHQAAVRRGDELAEAAARRAEIEQAKGILMAAHRVDADTAYAQLSHLSQSTNTKLHDLATDILTRATS